MAQDAVSSTPTALGDHVDRLFRAAWALCGSREDAEDLVQDTYAERARQPALLRNDDDLGYLLRVLRNTFISCAHRGAARRQRGPMPEDLEPVDPRSARVRRGDRGAGGLRARSPRCPTIPRRPGRGRRRRFLLR